MKTNTAVAAAAADGAASDGGGGGGTAGGDPLLNFNHCCYPNIVYIWKIYYYFFSCITTNK